MSGYVEKNCLACGDLIRVRLADHKRGWGKFCDKACAAAHKCGQRPRDVNPGHTESPWAMERLAFFAKHYGESGPPNARAIKEQIGRNIKVKPAARRPSPPREFDLDEDNSWDAHKVWR